MLDGTVLSLEIRQGRRYSVFEIALPLPVEHWSITAVNRTYQVLNRAYRAP